MFDRGSDSSSQICVYVRGEVVVDYWASKRKRDGTSDYQYGGSSLANVFSTTKNLTAICVAKLVEQGHLDYSEKVTNYWPEFGQNGKEELRLCDIMRYDETFI